MGKNIVLVGLMGAGKTTTGKLLCQKLGYDLIDSDELIEKNTQMSIITIFKEHGEEYFRDIETKTISDISKNTDTIISTGGGSLERAENIENLKNGGILFYLKASPDVLFERIKTDKTRPLLQNDHPLKILSSLLVRREANYLMADYVISTDDNDFDRVANEIIEKYNEHENPKS